MWPDLWQRWEAAESSHPRAQLTFFSLTLSLTKWTSDYLVTYDMGQIRYHPSERAVGRERVLRTESRPFWAEPCPPPPTGTWPSLNPVIFSKLFLTDAARLQTSGSCLKHHTHRNGTCIWVLLGHPEPVGSPAECSRIWGLYTSSKKISLPERCFVT